VRLLGGCSTSAVGPGWELGESAWRRLQGDPTAAFPYTKRVMRIRGIHFLPGPGVMGQGAVVFK